MRTTYLIQQHEKCIALLGMIDSAKRQAKNCHANADTLQNYSNRKEADRWARKGNSRMDAADRLRSYYLKTIESITEKAIL